MHILSKLILFFVVSCGFNFCLLCHNALHNRLAVLSGQLIRIQFDVFNIFGQRIGNQIEMIIKLLNVSPLIDIKILQHNRNEIHLPDNRTNQINSSIKCWNLDWTFFSRILLVFCLLFFINYLKKIYLIKAHNCVWLEIRVYPVTTHRLPLHRFPLVLVLSSFLI